MFTSLPDLRSTLLVSIFASLLVLLAACGGDDAGETDTSSDEPVPTATEPVADAPDEDPTPSPEPTATEDTDDGETEDPTPEPDPIPTEVAEEPDPTPTPEPEPDPDVDLAPELAGLTDWRNIDPVSLEDLRGGPVVLVFWNSI